MQGKNIDEQIQTAYNQFEASEYVLKEIEIKAKDNIGECQAKYKQTVHALIETYKEKIKQLEAENKELKKTCPQQ